MRRAICGVAVLSAALLSGSPSAQAPPQTTGRPSSGRGTTEVNGREAVQGEVLVRWRQEAGARGRNEIRALVDADAIDTIGRTRLDRVRSRSLDVQTLLARLAGRGDIAYVEPNYVVRTLADPNDPSFPQLWGLANTGQPINGSPGGTPGADIHAREAWDVSTGSTDQVVAVIDTGIDYTHPDLAPNMWSAPADFTVTIGGVSMTCPAGSHGFNAIQMNCNPLDDHNHGTHVSGTIGGAGNNGAGVVGVNWVTRLMGIKFLDAGGSGTLADAINGIDFAIQVKQAFASTGGANVRVLSNSWGGKDFSQALFDEILAANTHDMLFVAAAGNDGFTNDLWPTYPASFDAPNIVSVAATTNTDARAWFSNYGSNVHLGAPGQDIYSTTIGNHYAFFSGTSMATPHVAGTAALVLSRCALDTAALKDVILSTVQPVAALASVTSTGGRLDANSAIRSCTAPPEVPTGLLAQPGNNRVTLTWSGGTGAVSYAVERSLTSGGPYAPLASNVKTKTYIDTTAVNGTTYYYVVSAINPMGESGLSNEASATPNAPSDLIVSSFTMPSSGGSGSPLAISVTTKNQGTGPAVASSTRFYLSANTLLGPEDTLLDNAQSVPGLSPGTSSAAAVTVAVPAGLATGTYYVVAKADADGTVFESSEANNTSLKLVSIGPDLVVSALTAPASAAPGASIVATDTVKNQGGGSSTGSTTRFYLSTNTIADADDQLLTAGRAVPGLAATATSVGSTTLTLPTSLVAGTYYVLAKADGDLGVTETQESNNVTARSIQIGGDLVVQGLTAPAKAGAGTTIQVGETTANQGAGTIGASTTRFYLSVNAVLDAPDTQLAGGHAVPDLAAGTGNPGSTTVTIPSPWTAGTYYLVAKADADGTAPETQESNNTAVRTIQIGPDLIVSSLTVPSIGAVGGTIDVTDTVTNSGAGGAGGSTTRFFLSKNTILDALDPTLTGGRTVLDLAAGGVSSGQTTLPIPAATEPGVYYLIARADGDDGVLESVESNNTMSRSIAIGPDLAVTVMNVNVTTVAAGSTISVTETVVNQGAGTAGASTSRFYLSPNYALDAGDAVLDGSRGVLAIAQGGSSSGTTAVTIPAGTAPGTYYLFVKSDADNGIAESQESNNTKYRIVTVVQP
jgi:subtilisin family serine protease/subtilase family serine protease